MQGNIANGYDPDIYERYGQVLLQMGDLVEAGKFLFLSGQRDSTYGESIDLYLKRFAKADHRRFISTFPKAARLSKIEDYPEVVQSYFAENGITNELLPKLHPAKCEPLSKMDVFVFYLVLSLFVIVLISGAYQIIELICAWFN